jgi:hypothetical protein
MLNEDQSDQCDQSINRVSSSVFQLIDSFLLTSNKKREKREKKREKEKEMEKSSSK